MNKLRGFREMWQFDNRLQLIANRIIFPREPLQIYRLGKLDILMDYDSGDANGARAVLTSDMYRKYLGRIFPKKGVTVFDIGANNGGFPLLLAAENFEINKVVSVELSPLTFSRLKFNLDRNFLTRSTAVNCAITGESREVGFTPGKDGSVSDNIYNIEANGSFFQIAGRTFDEVFGEYFDESAVDICKIDIEGAEFEMLAAGNCENLRRCKYLMIEIHHTLYTPRDNALSAIEKLGFQEIDGGGKNDERHHVHFFENHGFI
ncbi:MAG: FkbM family methyltransferase [Acidobacteria bacterium]|nr:FkbM family methyltransferase [Acidobacteriota bacterium]